MTTVSRPGGFLKNKAQERWEVLVLVILGIIIRIPRVPGIIGDDAFVVLWMGLAISEGSLEMWTISPVSPFGLHAYSPGAIGVPSLISLMIALGLPYEMIVLVISLASSVIGTVGAYMLGTELFGTRQGSFFFALFYSYSHLFLRFTYFTISLRGPLLAVLPWFLYYCVKTVRSRESEIWALTADGLMRSSPQLFRNLVFSMVLFVILVFIHGLAVFLVLYAAVVVGYYVIRAVKNTVRFDWIKTLARRTPDAEERMTAEETISSDLVWEDIQASMTWLRILPERIPRMDDALVIAVRKELVETHELFDKAFRAERIMASADESQIRLKAALLERIKTVISQIDSEVIARLADGHTIRVSAGSQNGLPSELKKPGRSESVARRSRYAPRHLAGDLGFELHPSSLVSWVVLFLLMGGAYFIGTVVLPIQAAKTASFLGLSNESFLGLSINLVVDYGIRLGLMSLFFPIGILVAFRKDRSSDRRIVHYILIPLVMFTIPMSTYSSVLFLPVFGYYSVVGLSIVWESFSSRWMGIFSLVFVLAFGLSYQLIVVSLPFWIPVLIVSVVLFSFAVMINRLRTWYSHRTIIGRTLRRWKSVVGQGPGATFDRLAVPVFLVSVIVISLMTTEGLLLQSDYTYVSNDERRVIEFLGTQLEPGITFVPTPVIGRRLEAFGLPAVLSYNDAAALYFGWTNVSSVISSCHLSLLAFFRGGNLYVSDDPDWTPERVIHNTLFNIDLTDPSEYDLAKETGLEYVLVEKNGTGYSDVFHTTYGDTPSMLLRSAPLACILALDLDQMSLFRLF